MANQGQAADYYNDTSGPKYPPQSQQQYNAPQGPPPQQQYNQGPPQQYNQGPPQNNAMPAPPGYGQNFGYNADQKPSFNQAFKVDKPRYNDLWAAILYLAVFAGFVAVSGISIEGYAHEKGYNGGGIYGSSNTFGLNTNTIVLFGFVLAVALVLGYLYVSLARGV